MLEQNFNNKIMMELYNNKLIEKLENMYILDGRLANALASSFYTINTKSAKDNLNFNMSLEFSASSLGKSTNLDLINLLKDEYDSSNEFIIDGEYLSCIEHRLPVAELRITYVCVRRVFDEVFKKYHYILNMNVDLVGKEVVDQALEFIRAMSMELNESYLVNHSRAFGWKLKDSTKTHKFMTKLNIKKLIECIPLQCSGFKDLEVEVKNTNEVYIFYRLYPKLSNI